MTQQPVELRSEAGLKVRLQFVEGYQLHFVVEIDMPRAGHTEKFARFCGSLKSQFAEEKRMRVFPSHQ